MGYDSSNSTTTELITSDPNEGGLFIWTTAVKNSLKQIKEDKDKVARQQLLINYAYELVSELMLDPSKNISESKGFEKVMIAPKK